MQSRATLEAYNYDKALVLAIKAKKAAETAQASQGPIKIYAWCVGAAIAIAIVAAVIFF
jgi:hypothetical protein